MHDTEQHASGGRLEAVVLDVDGTLVDSERDGHRVAFNQAFEDAGLPYRWGVEEYGDHLRVTGGRRRIEAFLLEEGHDPGDAAEQARKLHEAKTGIFREMVRGGDVPLRPGVARLVAELDAAGVRLFVATTGSRAWVEPLLDRHFGEGAFELVVTGTEVTRLKPDPAVYEAVLQAAGLDTSGVVAIEDSANGLVAARGALLPCLVVTNDYTVHHDLTGAALVVDGFGPGAQRVAGADVPLPDGAVTVATLAALAR